MTDTIRSISIAESAQRAARHAVDTLEHMPNPWPADTDDHAKWAAAYDRAFRELTAAEGQEGSA